jgi:hypothetical protein
LSSERRSNVATKADFTQQEWETMQKGVMGAGLLVSLSDPDFTDTFGEASAIAKYLAEQRSSAASGLIREVAAVRGRGGFGITDSRDEVEAETLGALRSAQEALEAKARDEVEAYRTLVLGVAERAATAKSGVQAAETAAIEKVREALA